MNSDAGAPEHVVLGDRALHHGQAEVQRRVHRLEEADHVVSQVVESYCIASRYSSNSGALTFNQNPNAFDRDGMMKFYPKPPGAARS